MDRDWPEEIAAAVRLLAAAKHLWPSEDVPFDESMRSELDRLERCELPHALIHPELVLSKVLAPPTDAARDMAAVGPRADAVGARAVAAFAGTAPR
jgi:hypothetical protein